MRLRQALSDSIHRQKDPEYNGTPLSNVLVIGVSRSNANRRVFEDGFAEALREAGIPAAASYPFVPESGVLSKARIKKAVVKTDASGVLITRVRNSGHKKRYQDNRSSTVPRDRRIMPAKQSEPVRGLSKGND